MAQALDPHKCLGVIFLYIYMLLQLVDNFLLEHFFQMKKKKKSKVKTLCHFGPVFFFFLKNVLVSNNFRDIWIIIKCIRENLNHGQQ